MTEITEDIGGKGGTEGGMGGAGGAGGYGLGGIGNASVWRPWFQTTGGHGCCPRATPNRQLSAKKRGAICQKGAPGTAGGVSRRVDWGSPKVVVPRRVGYLLALTLLIGLAVCKV